MKRLLWWLRHHRHQVRWTTSDGIIVCECGGTFFAHGLSAGYRS